METQIAQRKVLVLDDDEGVLQSIHYLLRHQNCESLTTQSWTDALELLNTENPDLLLLDLSMPHIDGPSFLEFIREEGSQIPVIVVSGYLTDEIRANMEPMHIEAFIEKPFHVADLGQAIDSALGRSVSLHDEGPDERTLLELGTDPDAAGDLLDALHRHQSVISGDSPPDLGTDSPPGLPTAPQRRKRHHRSAAARKRTVRHLLLMALVCVLVAGTLGTMRWYLGSVSLESVAEKAVQSLKETSVDRANKAAERE